MSGPARAGLFIYAKDAERLAVDPEGNIFQVRESVS